MSITEVEEILSIEVKYLTSCTYADETLERRKNVNRPIAFL